MLPSPLSAVGPFVPHPSSLVPAPCCLFFFSIPLCSSGFPGCFSWLPCLPRACSCCHSFSSFSVILRFFRYSTQLSQRQYKNKWVSPCYPIVQRFLFKLFLDGFKLKQLILYLRVELQTQKYTEMVSHYVDHRPAIEYKYVFHRLSPARMPQYCQSRSTHTYSRSVLF